jgi:putative hydrolase of the HAD superfamily
MRVRAVVFDLWETLVGWPAAEAEVLRRTLADRIGVSHDEVDRRMQEHYIASQTGPLATVYRTLGLPEYDVEEYIAARVDFARRALRPRDGVVETLAELRRRGLRVGLISMCSEDVPAAWPETELAGLFDAETFSASCGLIKPEPAIYLHTAAALGVQPEECLFVGDGANDELAGAARVGMTPVLFLLDGQEPSWPEVTDWRGLRVSSIPEVLELC